MNILLTRPRAQAEALATILAADGWTPVIHPMLDFAPTGADAAPGDARALVFTSANGVRAAGTRGFDGPVYAVGAATARAARMAGFADVVEADGDGAALARLMLVRGETGPVLHLRGRHAAGGLAAGLAEGSVALREAVVYEMRAAKRLEAPVAAMLRAGEIAAAPFYSERTARIFARLLDDDARAGLAATIALAISAEAARPLSRLGFARIDVAETPSGAAMLSAMRKLKP